MRKLVLAATMLLACSGGDAGPTAPGTGPGTNPPSSAPRATTLSKVSGDAQSGTAGSALAQPLVVKVTDQNGAALAGVVVSWSITAGGGVVDPASSTTDAGGEARTTLRLGSAAGANAVTASVAGINTPATFTATANAPPITGDYLASASALSSEYTHVCALTANGAAACWGMGGADADDCAGSCLNQAPRLIAGGLTFKAIATGSRHACGLTNDGRIYCWGMVNTPAPVVRPALLGTAAPPASCTGRVGGNNVIEPCSTRPLLVSGNITFSALASTLAPGHSCAIATTGAAYCWGMNYMGELGNGESGGNAAVRPPVVVAGGLTFKQIDTGTVYFSCGVTTDGTGYCWGADGNMSTVFAPIGQLGATASTTCDTAPDVLPGRVLAFCSRAPVRVNGGLTFTMIKAGSYGACGLTSAGDVYCWGNQLVGGNAGITPRLVPGGIKFKSISFEANGCGISMEDRIYCWGLNAPTLPTPTATPIALNDGRTYAAVTASITAFNHTICAITTGGELRCGANRMATPQ